MRPRRCARGASAQQRFYLEFRFSTGILPEPAKTGGYGNSLLCFLLLLAQPCSEAKDYV